MKRWIGICAIGGTAGFFAGLTHTPTPVYLVLVNLGFVAGYLCKGASR